MKDFIVVNISPDHNAESGTNTLGRAGEGYTTQLYITLPEELLGFNAYLDFEKPNGETIRTPKLEVTDGVAFYDVSPYILSEHGELKVQFVLQGENGEIWKSSIKRYIVQKSINAVEDIPEKEDFITEAQKVLDALSQEVAEVAEILANDAEFSQAVIDACGGQTKINTINGIPLRFFVGLQSEYDTFTDKQKENLFAIITDDKTKERINKLLEDIMGDVASLEQEVTRLKAKPVPVPLESKKLTEAGYYHISVLYEGDFWDCGEIYWDGEHSTFVSIMSENMILWIDGTSISRGELNLLGDRNSEVQIDFSGAVFYVAKVG